MKNKKNIKLVVLIIVILGLSITSAFAKMMKYKTTSYDEKPILIPIELSYDIGCECFTTYFKFSDVEDVDFYPKYSRSIFVYGLEKMKAKKVKLKVKLEKTKKKRRFIDGIEEIMFIIDGVEEVLSFKGEHIKGNRKEIEFKEEKTLILINLSMAETNKTKPEDETNMKIIAKKIKVNNIPIINEHNYQGTAIITDNLGNVYRPAVTPGEINVQITSDQIKEARLRNGFDRATGIKFDIAYANEKNAWEIMRLWKQETFTFKFILESCGQKMPNKIDAYVDGTCKDNDILSQVKKSFLVENKGIFEKQETLRIPFYKGHFQDDVKAFVKNEQQQTIEFKRMGNIFTLHWNICKPALAVVIFLTNSRKGLIKQDIIDRETREIFSLASTYRLYVGWVSYNRTRYQLNNFENVQSRQINISEINTNDTTETTLKKIEADISRKFIKSNEPTKLIIILDSSTVSYSYTREKGYSNSNLSVKFVDIDDISKMDEFIKED